MLPSLSVTMGLCLSHPQSIHMPQSILACWYRRIPSPGCMPVPQKSYQTSGCRRNGASQSAHVESRDCSNYEKNFHVSSLGALALPTSCFAHKEVSDPSRAAGLIACNIPTRRICGEECNNIKWNDSVDHAPVSEEMTACLFLQVIWYGLFDDQEPQRCGSYTTRDKKYLQEWESPILTTKSQPVAALVTSALLSGAAPLFQRDLSLFPRALRPGSAKSVCQVGWKKSHDGETGAWLSTTSRMWSKTVSEYPIWRLNTSNQREWFMLLILKPQVT